MNWEKGKKVRVRIGDGRWVNGVVGVRKADGKYVVNIDDTRVVTVPYTDIKLKSLQDIDTARTFVAKLNYESRASLRQALMELPETQPVIIGCVVRIPDRLDYGVIIGMRQKGAVVWIVGTNRMTCDVVPWGTFYNTGVIVKVGMTTPPHTIPRETELFCNKRWCR